MKMHRLEKLLVNRQRKGKRNIASVHERLRHLDLSRTHDVLELGCGIGAVAAFLASHYSMNVHGTDCDPEQIARARQQHRESATLYFSVQDATALHFDDASFDLVISQSTLHHIPDWQQALSEVSRVLRPGGYFLWFDFACPTFLKAVLRPLACSVGLYTLEDVATGLRRNGLTPCFHQRLTYGPFVHHRMVWHKKSSIPQQHLSRQLCLSLVT
jgi:ubiquinone/menaquinone biosynthesis C-methylase UbiE